jgi:hypothetical protein
MKRTSISEKFSGFRHFRMRSKKATDKKIDKSNVQNHHKHLL